jgi:hypothetical protein
MYACMDACMDAWIETCRCVNDVCPKSSICTYIHMFLFTCILYTANHSGVHRSTFLHEHNIHTYIHTYIQTYMHASTCMHTFYAFIHSCIHICLRAYIHTYIHTYIHILYMQECFRVTDDRNDEVIPHHTCPRTGVPGVSIFVTVKITVFSYLFHEFTYKYFYKINSFWKLQKCFYFYILQYILHTKVFENLNIFWNRLSKKKKRMTDMASSETVISCAR